MAGDHIEDVEFASAEELDDWLLENHERRASIWGVFWKKATPANYIDRHTLLRTVLRYGWIDSLPRKLDDTRSKLLLSPRKSGSAWSAVNKAVIAQLRDDGTLHAAGKRCVDAAIADGSWTFLDDVEAGILPDDLRKALQAKPPAQENFDAFPQSAKRGILEWIAQAKRDVTRRNRIAETAELAAQNKRALDWRAKNRR